MARERGVWARVAGPHIRRRRRAHLEKRAVDVEARAVGLLEGELDGGAPREVRQLGVLLRRRRLLVPEGDEPLELGDLVEERGVRLRRFRRAGGELRFERRHPRVELGDERLRLRAVLGGHALHQRRRLAARHRLRLRERADGVRVEQPRRVVLALLEALLQLAHLLRLRRQPEAEERQRVLVHPAPAARRQLLGLRSSDGRHERRRRRHLQRREQQQRRERRGRCGAERRRALEHGGRGAAIGDGRRGRGAPSDLRREERNFDSTRDLRS